MLPLPIVTGDATDPPGPGPKIIAHVCNDIGAWGKGFVVALSRRRPEPERDFRAWHRDADGFRLGATRLVRVRPDLRVANMIGQHGIHPRSAGPPIRYEAVAECLDTLGDEALRRSASVHMPRIGCGPAGGRWELIEPLVTKALCDRDIPTTVYDLA